MARKPRILIPNIPHHITQRGNRRQRTFFCEEDFKLYLELLDQNCKDFEVDVLGFCLMSNHVHIIVQSHHGPLIRNAIAETHEQYTRRVNLRNGWRGHLWQGRFFSCPMSPCHFERAMNYVLVNPVRAGICDNPGQYSWNSLNQDLESLAIKNHKIDGTLEFTAEEIKDFRQCSRSGRPFGDQSYFEELEKKMNQRFLRNKGGRPKKL